MSSALALTRADTSTRPVIRAATYARVSEVDRRLASASGAENVGAPALDTHGVVNQGTATADYCDARGWLVVGRYVDNDVKASAGKKPDADYHRMMAAAARGEFDVIVAFQTSRLWRNRRERADGIEILRNAPTPAGTRGISIHAVKGPSLNMSDAYGRGMAGLLGEFDTMEVEIKAERTQLANASAVRAGKRLRGAHRPFGYQPGGIRKDPAEAAAIEWAADALLGGATVAAVTREWERRGLVTVQTGRPFTRQSVTTILRNPRIAGLAVYGGEIMGRGEQDEILPEHTWRAVDALLADPARKPPRGVRTLLGGLATCPCGNVVMGATNHHRYKVYRCAPASRAGRPGPHVAVRAEPVDEWVEDMVLDRLSMPDLADLVSPPPQADTAGLRAEAAAIRRNLDEMAADRALGLVSRSQMIAATERGSARLAQIAAALAEAGGAGALAPFLAPGAVARQVWGGLDLSRKREVIRTLGSITLLPAGTGARVFDARKVRFISPAGEDLTGRVLRESDQAAT